MVKVKALMKQALLKEENIKPTIYTGNLLCIYRKILPSHQLFKKYQKYRCCFLQCSWVCEGYKSKILWTVQKPPEFYVINPKYINWCDIAQDKLIQTLLLSLAAL